MNVPQRPNRPAGEAAPLHLNWQSITVKPWSLVRLKEYINPMFPAGTIVALSNELVADYSTPTKYENQGPPNLNASTRVRVYLWSQTTAEFAHPSVDGGKPFSIQHKHLTPVDPNVRPRGGWKLDTLVTVNIPPNVTYRTEHLPVHDPRGPTFQIPNGTVGVVRKCMTGTNRLRTVNQEANSNRTDWWYVVSVNLRKKEWSWVRCQEWVSVLSLQRLMPEEVARADAFINSTSGPPEITVVSNTSTHRQ